jgi:hypothetical protein
MPLDNSWWLFNMRQFALVLERSEGMSCSKIIETDRDAEPAIRVDDGKSRAP